MIPSQSRCSAPRSARKTKTPVGVRRGSSGIDEEWLAADLEHLGAALGAGALERLLAVLHRDLLRIHDFDFHLVLDAVGLGHSFRSSPKAPKCAHGLGARSHA